MVKLCLCVARLSEGTMMIGFGYITPKFLLSEMEAMEKIFYQSSFHLLMLKKYFRILKNNILIHSIKIEEGLAGILGRFSSTPKIMIVVCWIWTIIDYSSNHSFSCWIRGGIAKLLDGHKKKQLLNMHQDHKDIHFDEGIVKLQDDREK